MSTIADWVQAAWNPSPIGILIIFLLVITVPVFIHSVIFRTSGLTTLPSILLTGPSGSGKTSLLTLFERGTVPAQTHTSQSPITAECILPVGTTASSDKYRSNNDPTNLIVKKFLLVDTPGHGKLRHHSLNNLPQNLKGIIFLVDAATLSAGDEGLRSTADYLHDVLLLLQKRGESKDKAAKQLKEVPVLIAANKMDLFTALPAALVKSSLEAEISKVRTSRSKGLLDSGTGLDEDGEKDDWLGEVGSKDFKFSQMEEFDVLVEVAGGNITGSDKASTEKWWKWIADRL